MEVRPLVKWAGGKRQILSDLLGHLPPKWNTYYEPFGGGLALLTALYNRKKLRHAVISDLNDELINLYVVVKEHPKELIKMLHSLDLRNTSEIYIKNRKRFNQIRGKNEYAVERAALFLYLNKHGYNGLWRVNKKGEFNVPFGRYKNPRLPTDVEILNFSKMLQQVEIKNEDFEIAVRTAKKGDFVYFDPPYQPVSSTAYFTDYTSAGFTADDQKRLAQVCKKLHKKGVFFMVSNSDTIFIREIYQDFNIYPLVTNRYISSNPKTRKKAGREVIITNYSKEVLLWDLVEKAQPQEKLLST